jgi:hypothetical protein
VAIELSIAKGTCYSLFGYEVAQAIDLDVAERRLVAEAERQTIKQAAAHEDFHVGKAGAASRMRRTSLLSATMSPLSKRTPASRSPRAAISWPTWAPPDARRRSCRTCR